KGEFDWIKTDPDFDFSAVVSQANIRYVEYVHPSFIQPFARLDFSRTPVAATYDSTKRFTPGRPSASADDSGRSRKGHQRTGYRGYPGANALRLYSDVVERRGFPWP